MKVERSHEECWALSHKFLYGRDFLGIYCWSTPNTPIESSKIGIALFGTRKEARKAQKTCCYHNTRVEKVRVTVETIK